MGQIESVKNLHWFGQSAFRLDVAEIIYFDPFGLPKDSPTADIVLVSHEHFDHCSPADLKIICTKETVIAASKDAAEKIKSAGLPFKELKVMAPNEEFIASGYKIKAVPAYNIGKAFHEKDALKLGFIVDTEGTKIYHAGDTDFIPEMKNFSCDIAMLPVGGTYTMTAAEAAQAALAIKPKVAVPMHYGKIVGSINDAAKFQELLKGKIEVKILTKEN